MTGQNQKSERKHAHQIFKKFKVGMITDEDLSDDDIMLLSKYYSFMFEKQTN